MNGSIYKMRRLQFAKLINALNKRSWLLTRSTPSLLALCGAGQPRRGVLAECPLGSPFEGLCLHFSARPSLVGAQ